MPHALLTPLLSLLTTLFLALPATTVAGEEASDDVRVDYARDIHPILKKHCFKCHGEEKQKGELRLDLHQGLFEGPDPDFPPVVPGEPEASTLLELLLLDDDDSDRMPKKADPLPTEQVELIRRWIEQGATWSEVESTSPSRGPEQVAAAVAALEQHDSSPLPERIDFNLHIRPLLSDNCFRCHGPDGEDRHGDLRLDTREGAFAVREDGRSPVVAGEAHSSLVIDRITRDDAETRMPPADSGRTLDAAQRRLLIRWIEQGASWNQHWSFVPPRLLDPPDVDRSGWARNEIDRFILQRLAREGLAPSAEADRRTLARRVTLDLTGLPPTPAEVEAFVTDPSPDAYETLVDRLLDEPRYGEQMARIWLDAARYGDTHGLHLDNYREMWPYRDWVIRAFNQNLPYDRFAIEQLAGDLLPDADLDQQIASGFNRCHVSTNEGGSIEEEVYVRNVSDRVSTMGTVFMGLSLGCAACHDHKFDPILQKEFYQLFAFFNNLDGKPMDGNAKAHPPVVQVPTEEQGQAVARLEGELEQLETEISAELEKVTYSEPDLPWPHADAPRRTKIWVDDLLPVGAQEQADGFEWVSRPVHSGERALRQASRGIRQQFFLDADDKLRIGTGDRLFCWVWLDPEEPTREVMLQFNSRGTKDGWLHGAFWGENLIAYGKEGTTQRVAMGDLPAAGEWVELSFDPLDVGLAPGSVVHGIAFNQFDGVVVFDTIGIESSTPQQPEPFVWVDDHVPSGGKLGGDGDTWNWVGGDDHPVHSGHLAVRRSMGDRLNQDYFTGAAPLSLHSGDRLFAHVWLDPEDPPKSIQLQFNNGNWEHRIRFGEPAHGKGREGGADLRAGDLPATGEWVRLEASLDQVGLKPGEELNGWAFTQVGGTVYWDQAGVVTWSPPDDRHLESMRVWEQRALADASLPEPVRTALQTAAAERDDAAGKLLRDHYLRHVYSGTRQVFDGLQARVADRQKQLEEIDAAIATTLVMKERLEPKAAFLLERGEYDAKGEQVERVTPATLPPMAADLPKNRLGLGRWLTDPDHPLTSRVAVNRFWQQMFGTGLVRTSEEFGSQGEVPSHPELLDWLARRFIEDGWDVKQTLKRMVMSATYRQDSRSTDLLRQRDPENRLLARGPRYRLDAEVLRDQALFVSGLLIDRLGGPSVKPPQPDGLWYAVGYTSSNTARFKADQGPEKVHRRTLYTFIKRTAPPPQMVTFDAPNRESCMVRRERTNTPLQALLLLNDPQYFEAARALGGRMLREGGGSSGSRIEHGFYLALGRRPDPEDARELVAFHDEMLELFQNDPERASKLLGVGEAAGDPNLPIAELAAAALVANLILNLDEVINKG